MRDARRTAAFEVELRDQPLLLLARQPGRVFRPVGQPDERGDAEQHGGCRFQQEDPLPAAQPEQSVHVENPARDRRADQAGDRDRHHEDADDDRAIMRRVPVGDVEDHAGKEPGLGGAEQEAQHQERDRPADQRERRRHEAPGDHDARDPGARAEPLQRQVGGHFEDEVANEEDAGAETVGLRVDADRLVHLQRGEADVDPVDVADQVGQQQERHQPPGDAAHGGGFERESGGRGRHHRFLGYSPVA